MAAIAGLLAAVLVPLDRPGLGWALAGLAVCAAVALGVRQTDHPAAGTDGDGGRRNPTPPRRAGALAWGLVALALLAVGAVRAAWWLFGLCLLAAAAAVVLAVTDGRTVRGMALGTLLVPAAAWRGTVWAHRGLTALRRGRRPAIRLGRTATLTAVILLTFGALLASADAGFSHLLGHLLPDLSIGSLVRWAVLFVAAAGVVLGSVFLLLAPPTTRDRGQLASTSAHAVPLAEWAVPVSALVALFAGFVGVQLTVLFGGAAYVLGADGPSYAQYARGGFWQLLTVTVLTLVVIGLAARVAPRRRRGDRWWLRALLGALAVLTLVIVGSALFRMHTYQEAYGFTRLRMLVSVVELWLGLVFLLVLAAGVRLRASWLPRAVVATGVAALLALAVLNPDRFIAERNIDRWADGERLDVSYLAVLSADAVPALVRLPSPQRGCALASTGAALSDSADDWRSANLARTNARGLLDADVDWRAAASACARAAASR